MLLRYRLGRRDGSAGLDVSVDVARGATVGDVAGALWAADPARDGTPPPGLLTLRTIRRGGPGGARPLAHQPLPAPGEPARRSAPPSGSTVEPVPAEPSPDGVPALVAPVRLVATDGHSRTLRYGTNRLAPGVELEITRRLLLVTAGSTEVRLDGARVDRTARPTHGSLLRLDGDVVTVHLDGTLRPPSPGPFHPLSRARTRWPPPARPAGGGPPDPPDPVEFPAPPAAARRPALPVLSAVVPLLLGGALWWATRSVAVAGFVLASFLFVLATAAEQRREWRAEQRFRVEEFRADLAEAAALLAASHDEDRRRDEAGSPPVAAVAAAVADGTAAPWTATAPAAGGVVVRVGSREGPGDRRPRVPAGGRRALRRELADAVAEADRVPRPLTVDLRDGLGITGPDDQATGLARAAVLQAVLAHGPDELSLEVVAGPAGAERWSWSVWLPHHGAAADVVLQVVDEPTPTQRRALAVSGDRPTVWLGARPEDLPDEVRATVECGATAPGAATPGATRPGPSARLHLPGEPPLGFRPEPIDTDTARAAARALAPLVPAGGTGAAGDGPGADGPSLADVLDEDRVLSDPALLRARWEACPATTPAAPIGLGPDGVVGVDLVADGPHTLVAGTTGSGKSELLRTLVVSLALHHPPDRLSFLLVDYKGGETFGPLAELPHCVGLVTDLTPAMCHRALVALGAELRRREAHTDGAPDPCLVVVVDEFATLAREVPDFVDGVLDVARRGRSLGIHLVLATQRPADSVTDAIRANTELRIALRVADPADSEDVLGVADAAALPRARPGTALLRSGPDRLQPVRVASCSRPVRHRAVEVRPLTAVADRAGHTASHTDESHTPTELAVATATCRAAAAGRPLPPTPWLPPLSEEMPPPPPADRPLRLAIGWVDRPDRQARPPLEVDLGAGGVLVLGGPRSGGTTALRALAEAASRHPADPMEVHHLGPGGTERDLRLLRHLSDRTDRAATTLVLVDGLGPFLDLHDHVNRGEAGRLLSRLATHGRATGVHVAVTARRPTEVPPDLRSALTHRLVLRGSPDDLDAAGVAAGMLGPSSPPGRGVLGGHPVQVALHPNQPAVAQPVTPTAAVGLLPTTVRADRLGPAVDWWIPLGPAADDPVPDPARPVGLDLSASHALVVGPPRSGRSTALALLADRVDAADAEAIRVVHVDGRHADPTELTVTVRTLLDAPVGSPTLLLVDDLPDLLEAPGGEALDAALLALVRTPVGPGASGGVRLVAGAEADALARCYAGIARRLRVLRTGILLRPDPDLHPPLLHTELPLRQELPPAPGRGWVVTPDGAPEAVQLARP